MIKHFKTTISDLTDLIEWVEGFRKKLETAKDSLWRISYKDVDPYKVEHLKNARSLIDEVLDLLGG